MFNISPSKVARYFYHECERHLYFQSASKERRAELQLPVAPFEQSPVTASIMEGGLLWEEKVISEKLPGQVYMSGNAEGRISERKLSHQETIEALRAPTHRFIYQATFMMPDSFYERYEIPKETVRLPVCYPDLIEVDKVDGRTIFRVIDVKSSDALKISHKVQVVLYALMLRELLVVYEIDADIDLAQGGVWLYEHDQPEWFNLSLILPHVEQFWRSTLPELTTKSVDALTWHLDYRCEWCPFYDYCKEQAIAEDHISLLPYLSKYGVSYLRHHQLPLSIPSMVQFVSVPENRQMLAKSTSFRNRLHRLPAQLQALAEDRLIPYGSFSADMPVWEDVRIIVTVQRDTISGKMFTAAIMRMGGEALYGTSYEICSFLASTPEEISSLPRNFIRTLYQLLEVVDRYNGGQSEWREQKSVQTYVTDNYEWENILEWVEEMLLDPELAEMALRLLFHFQCELLTDAEDHPNEYVPFPLVVLTSVVSRLFALPAHLAYRLEDLTRHLEPDRGKPFHYKAHDAVSFRLTNVMKSDLIHKVWNHGETDHLEWITKELVRRLWSAESIIRGIRAKAKNERGESVLFAWPQKFRFTSADVMQNPMLSKLSFMARYESVLNYLSIRNLRTKPRDERLEAGTTLEVTYLGGSVFQLGTNQMEEELEKGKWLFTEDSFQGELTHNSYYDYRYRNSFVVPSRASLYYADITQVSRETDRVLLHLKWKGSTSFVLVEGARYLLSKRFTDFTSDRVMTGLASYDQNGHWVQSFLADPMSWSMTPPVDVLTNTELEGLLAGAGFTTSQEAAFRQLSTKRLTAVWGPPGTGKTHFIAQAVLLLIRRARAKGQPLRILVSAFTHAAIENCLLKIGKLDHAGDTLIVKYGDTQTEQAKTSLAKVDDKGIVKLLLSEQCVVVGATLFQIQKAYGKEILSSPFDLVILDEASQIRLPESLLAIGRVHQQGRLLVVGDHFQLPPIVQGMYPEKKGEAPLFGSIFSWFIHHDPEYVYTKQLSDNFRMNETLCRYPALQIYGDTYTAYTADIAEQRIAITDRDDRPQWIRDVLDPAYSLVLCITENALEGPANSTEARLVSDLTIELRNHLLSSNGRDYGAYQDTAEGDRSFWQDGLFIISPHHAQNRLIRNMLEEQGLRPPFFVETVDKMQGQESDVAIISYGVADPELAVQEGSFIYSLNRLNVAITRSRAKTILFLSRQLLTPALELLSDQGLAEGLHFMTQLEAYCQEGQNITLYSRNDITVTCYRR